jgi:hypothetical protein
MQARQNWGDQRDSNPLAPASQTGTSTASALATKWVKNKAGWAFPPHPALRRVCSETTLVYVCVPRGYALIET